MNAIQPPYPRNVPLKKGRLAVTRGSERYTIAFQYNPESVSRTLNAHFSDPGKESPREDVFYESAAGQSISMRIFLEAVPPTDSSSARFGVFPQIAALELLLYQPTKDVTSENRSLDQGKRAIVKSVVPTVVLEWGKRAVPVRLRQLGVTEELFDADLNTIRATVDLSFDVVTYSTAREGGSEYNLFLSYQTKLEALAKATYTK